MGGGWGELKDPPDGASGEYQYQGPTKGYWLIIRGGWGH